MNTHKTQTGERITLHGDHIVTELTSIEDIVLACFDEVDESDERCKACDEYNDRHNEGEEICSACADELRTEFIAYRSQFHDDELDARDWDRGVTLHDIYGD